MKGSLAELQAVQAVARLGGFRAAARELGMSSSALSHAVAGLEERLGVRLFNRTTRSVSLTAAGEQFAVEIGPALAAIRRATEALDEHRAQPSGTLRLNVPLGAARLMLEPLVLEYLRRRPEVSVDLVSQNARVDIVAQGFDAGVRLAEFVPPDMIAVPMGPPIRSVVVGAPAYFEGREPPRTPGELQRHRCIRGRMGSGAIYRWEFEKRGESLAVDVPGRLILDEGDLILAAALAGEGLAFVPDFAAGPHLHAGRLVEVLADWTAPYPGLCLYYPGRRHVPAKLRAFVDLIRERSKRPYAEPDAPTAAVSARLGG